VVGKRALVEKAHNVDSRTTGWGGSAGRSKGGAALWYLIIRAKQTMLTNVEVTEGRGNLVNRGIERDATRAATAISFQKHAKSGEYTERA